MKEYVTGVTTGNVIEYWDMDSIDVLYEEHLLLKHFICNSCNSIFHEDDLEDYSCKFCGLDLEPIDSDQVDHDDLCDFGTGLQLYGDWIKGKDGKFEPDKNGECAFLYDPNDNIVQVVFSQYVMDCRRCSPCFPLQGDLDSPGDDYTAYCLPPNMVFEDWLEGKNIRRK